MAPSGRAGVNGNLLYPRGLDGPSCCLGHVTCFPVSFCLLQKVGLQMVAEKLGCGEGALGAVPEPWGWRPVCSASRLQRDSGLKASC